MPVIEKRGPWMVIVVTDRQGQVAAYAWKGTEPETAPRAIEDAEPGLGTRYIVHWERGFKTRQDAETRANEVNAEIQSESGAGHGVNTTIVTH